MKLSFLREKYPKFFYKSFSYKHMGGNLCIFFDFAVPPDISFKPTVVFRNVSQKQIEKIGEHSMQNFIFHLGLVEMISYWKATCSSEIIVEAGFLDAKQIKWWKNIILNGMGEYFYKNKINFTQKNFLSIICTQSSGDRINLSRADKFSRSRKIIIPIGGGKDSIVTLEILKQAKIPLMPFVLNPKKEQLDILKIAGEKNPIIVERTIDPTLLELNKKGFLNGHTPFSAYLAFSSVFASALFDCRYVTVSNERSSNEGNVPYLGKVINHQYSKSFEFEKNFREYCSAYLTKTVEYFSFLRPLYELQIAKIFAKFPQYFSVFLSCNEVNKPAFPAHSYAVAGGYGAARWCGKCPKCLFVFISLYPFIGKEQTIKIFNKNLLEDEALKPLLNELTGKQKFKPFECVGTTKESRIALFLSLHKKLPNLQKESEVLLHSWNKEHFVPTNPARLLKNMIP